MTIEHARDLAMAANIIAAESLSDAFGHLSVRTSPKQLLITPPVPLGLVTETSEFRPVETGAVELPPGVPKEAWLHLAIADRRSDVAAVCRAQPPAVNALCALDLPLLPLNGQSALLGPVVPVHPDSRLVRDRGTASLVADRLDDGFAIMLRGNGAVTCGATLGDAVATMWLLERSARITLEAHAAGIPHPLPEEEQAWWRGIRTELLPRMYSALEQTHTALNE